MLKVSQPSSQPGARNILERQALGAGPGSALESSSARAPERLSEALNAFTLEFPPDHPRGRGGHLLKPTERRRQVAVGGAQEKLAQARTGPASVPFFARARV